VTKKFYTVGIARFEGGPRTLKTYINSGKRMSVLVLPFRDQGAASTSDVSPS
jgi:hypothetical protein